MTHNSNLSYKRDVSIPSQNVSHNSLIWARNLPSGSQKMVFLTQQYLRIKEFARPLVETKRAATPRFQALHDPWREDILVDECGMGKQRYKDWS